MDITLLDILQKIDNSGFKAYIVGGFVRDRLLRKHSCDVDIATSATPKELKEILPEAQVINEYGAVKLKIGKYNIDITTFRTESDYENGKPKKIEYVDKLEQDIERRDFTINTICLDKDVNVIDLLNGKKDIKNKIIRVVGNTNDRFKEDPLRILRAIRFSVTLNFKLDHEIEEYLINNKEDLELINFNKRKYELEKILLSKNVYDFVKIVKKYELEEILGIHFSKLKPSKNLVGMWAQIDYNPKYSFTKIETEQIENIKSLVKKGNIDKYDVYKYGTYICLNAAIILGKNTKIINKLYEKLPIKDIIDINIDSNTICEVLNISPSKELGEVIKIIEREIIDYKLKNNREDIIKRIEKLKGEI